MASEYLLHTTSENDRWDLLAYHYYGDATLILPLLQANPSVASLALLPAGLKLVVPILEESEVTPDVVSGSVPWL